MSSARRTCAYHDNIPAIALCCECGEDICGECHGTTVQGLAICTECRRELAPTPIAWESAHPGPTPTGFARTFLALFLAPRTFFFALPPSDRWGAAAIFGILAVSFGSIANTLWQKSFSPQYSELVHRYVDELGTSITIAELAIFAAIPFGAVFLYFLHTALLYFTLKLFGAEEARWSLIARITGYSLGAYILLLIPPIGDFSLGHFLMVVWLFNLEVSAVRIFFRLGFWKSMGVVLLPFILFVFAVG